MLCIVVLIAGSAWPDHVRDDARRDAVNETHESNIAQIEQRITRPQSDAASGIAELERERKQLLAQPARAPAVIRELVPMQAPIQPRGNLRKIRPMLRARCSRDRQVDLAQYALGGKECSIDHDQLQQQTKDQQEIISRRQSSLMPRRNPRKAEAFGSERNALRSGERSSERTVT